MSDEYLEAIKSLSSLSRKFYDLTNRHQSHLERGYDLLNSPLMKDIYSFYMVDYDLSEDEVLFPKTPLFIEDNNAVKTWITAFYLRNELILGSFADIFFKQVKTFLNIEFLLGDTGDIIKKDNKIIIKIDQNEMEKIENLLSTPIENGDFNFNNYNNAKYIDYKDIENIVDKIQPLEENIRNQISEKFNNLSKQYEKKLNESNILNTIININIIKIALVLFVGQYKVSSFIIIPSIIRKNLDKEESSGGFIILFVNNKRIDPHKEYILTALANSWFRQNSTSDLSRKSEKLGEEKGKLSIAASVAHNLKNVCLGLTEVVRAYLEEGDYSLYVVGRYIESRITWLHWMNKGFNHIKYTKGLQLFEILKSGFVSGWEIFLKRADTNYICKFINENEIIAPQLLVINITQDNRKSTIFTPSYYINWWPGEWAAENINTGQNLGSDQNNPVDNINIRVDIPNVEGIVPAIEANFEEIFFNALKFSNNQKPLIITCYLSQDNETTTVQFVNPVANNTTLNKKIGGGVDGVKQFLKIQFGWIVSEPKIKENKYIIEVNIPKTEQNNGNDKSSLG